MPFGATKPLLELTTYLDMRLETYFPGIAMRWLQSFYLRVVIKTYKNQ